MKYKQKWLESFDGDWVVYLSKEYYEFINYLKKPRKPLKKWSTVVTKEPTVGTQGIVVASWELTVVEFYAAI